MKDVFLVYDTSCFYEIIILNYFMGFAGCDAVLCSLDGKPVRAMEGYSVNVDAALGELNLNNVRSFIVPGGNISNINCSGVWDVLQDLHRRNVLIAGICAGVDVLDSAGVLDRVCSTHSSDEDVVNDGNIITARANGYVDFAIEIAKMLRLFRDEADMQETIDFWKYHKRMQ